MSTPTDDILDAARKRLAAITAERATLDAEEAKLRRMLGAAEGQPEPAKPEALEEQIRRLLPVPPQHPPPMPWEMPFPPTPWTPVKPWWMRPDHGGLCACPQCCPPTYCRTFAVATERDNLRVLYVGDVSGTMNAIDHGARYTVS